MEKARRNLRHRPIGIGVQGLSDTYMLLRIPYESEEAAELNRRIFETIYYYSMEMSMEISKRQECLESPCDDYDVKLNEFEKDLKTYKGAYSTFDGSPLSRGLFSLICGIM